MGGCRLYVEGIRPPDEEWKKMKAIYDACMEAKVTIPDEVLKFFDCEVPDERGIVMALGRRHASGGQEAGDWKIPGVQPYSADMRVGVEIPIESLPANITHLRIFVDWN